MSNSVIADFFQGRVLKEKQVDYQDVLRSLRTGQQVLQTLSVDSIITILDAFGEKLSQRGLEIHRRFPESGISYIARWCRKSNLIAMLENAFATRKMLDAFVEGAGSEKERAYRLLPRGLAVHWMAGNVPTLGFLSLIQGILTKNANLIKTASASDDLLAQLLLALSQVSISEEITGEKIVRSVAVIRYDKKLKHIGAGISREADVRIFWGSDESVNELRKLPVRIHASDIVFANKTSFIAIDKESLIKMDLAAVAKKIATDVSVFEQKACASPHTLFLETDDPEMVEVFAVELHAALSKVLARIPKKNLSSNEISAILNLRTQYDMFHKSWNSKGLEFSLLNDDSIQIGPAIGNRTLFIRKITNLEKLADLITPDIQTVGLIAEESRYDELASLFAERGVQRFTNPGLMTHFEVPWDGWMLSHHLVRWVSRPS